jgi:lipopolysaccharide/colanic/teichoic acid biosynthesis glycosyltransferase
VDSAPPTVNLHSARATDELALHAWQSTLRSSALPHSSSASADGPSTHPFKRLLDICISLALLVLLLPLLVILSLAIWAHDDGPVLYVSQRIGRNGRPFTMYKFRTMIVGAELLRHNLNQRNERTEVLFKIANDPRITRIGRVLRKYSLDELPQLINVLRGDMSLVGPRPPLACEVEQYSPQQFVRLQVLPGITGLWQINARRSSSFHDYISLDAAYVQNWCLWLDVKILWRTVGVVLAGTGD